MEEERRNCSLRSENQGATHVSPRNVSWVVKATITIPREMGLITTALPTTHFVGHRAPSRSAPECMKRRLVVDSVDDGRDEHRCARALLGVTKFLFWFARDVADRLVVDRYHLEHHKP
jgi:hypothetical protein